VKSSERIAPFSSRRRMLTVPSKTSAVPEINTGLATRAFSIGVSTTIAAVGDGIEGNSVTGTFTGKSRRCP
jgi:hypothetical protein